MFDNKKTSFYNEKIEPTTTSNEGSYKLETTGDPFVDDFASISKYREARPIQEVFATMDKLWSINPLDTLKELVYIRLITRDTKLLNGESIGVNKGQGLRAETISRLMWLAINHLDVFKKNFDIFISAGSWNDMFELMRVDLSYQHGQDERARVLPWNFLMKKIEKYLKDENTANLIKKFLPTIKTVKKCKTLRNQVNNYIAKYIAHSIFAKLPKEKQYRHYRQLKASGNAHNWQQLISQQRYDEIDFNTIPGRALMKLANSEFLVNHNLEDKFSEWIVNQPIAKFTGYPYELFHNVKYDWQENLINKQFQTLLEVDKSKLSSDFICVVDTSGSMDAEARGVKSRSADVALSMALYCSYRLEGPFNKSWLEFNSDVKAHVFNEDTPYKNYKAASKYEYNGATNFLKVADFFVNAKNGLNIDESQFPKGIICFSDGNFSRESGKFKTDFHQFKDKLSTSFSKEFVDNFKIVLWDIPNMFYQFIKPTFETLANENNFYYMAGFDPAVVSFLFGGTTTKAAPKNAKELFETAIDQTLLNMLKL